MLSPVDEIKNKLDIVEVVSGYIRLQKAGKNLRANCPFHHEKTPSFFVSPERQSWHCFGCGAGGSIFDFVMQIEGVEFGDALRTLAQKAGVTLKREDPQVKTERQQLYEICNLAVKFFEKQLEATQKGNKITEYLLKRGIKKETIAGWNIGYAPDDWHGLEKFLKSRGYKDKEIINSGLVVEKESSAGRYYDRFRNRIMFPISDLNGQVVGISGRVLPDQKEEAAKYINTPQTAIYDKSRLLYGLDRAKMDIRQKDACVVVEGYTDVLMSHQIGLKNTVATCGTALTEEQLKLIKRYSENIILAFDMDAAGDNATKRGIDLAIELGLSVKIVLPENGSKDPEEKPSASNGAGKKQDPADIIKNDPEKWQKIVKSAQGVVEYYFASAFLKHDHNDISGKKAISKLVLPIIKKIPDKTEQGTWINELARRLRIQEKFLIEALNKIKIEKRVIAKENKPNQPKKFGTRTFVLEEELIALIISSLNSDKSACSVTIINNENKALFSDPRLKIIFSSLQDYGKSRNGFTDFDFAGWQRSLPSDASAYVDRLIFRTETMEPEKHSSTADPLDYCLKALKNEKIRQDLGILQKEIKTAEEQKDKGKLNDLLNKFKSISSNLIDAQ